MKMPRAPDPYATAQAQSQMNKETAIAQTGLNAMNQYTPDGSREYAQGGTWADGTPRFSVTETLSDANQRLFDLGKQSETNLARIGVDQSKRMGDLLATPVSFSGMGAVPTGPNASDARFALPGARQVATRANPDPIMVDRRQIGSNADLEQRLIELGRTRLDPALRDRRASLDATLADKGIKAGSDAYGMAMTQNAQAENDAYNQLILSGQAQAFGQARDRAQNDFSQDMARTGQFFNQGQSKAQNDFAQDLASRGQFFGEAQANADAEWNRATQGYGMAMQGRQQTIDEMLQERNQPINELSALMSGSQVSRPQWTATPQSQIAPTDLIGLVNNQYQARMQGYSGMLSGLGSLAGQLGSAGIRAAFPVPSDRRLKTGVVRIGALPNGLPVYRFHYIWGGGEQVGVMAQDVLQVMPEAVHVMTGGYLAVDYDKIAEAA